MTVVSLREVTKESGGLDQVLSMLCDSLRKLIVLTFLALVSLNSVALELQITVATHWRVIAASVDILPGI